MNMFQLLIHMRLSSQLGNWLGHVLNEYILFLWGYVWYIFCKKNIARICILSYLAGFMLEKAPDNSLWSTPLDNL